MLSKFRYCLLVVLFSLSCSGSREISGIYIHSERNIQGDLILINAESGEVHSWTSDLWIDYRCFLVKQIGETIVLSYVQNDHESDVFVKGRGGIEKVNEDRPNQRYRKVSQKQVRKFIPAFVFREVFNSN